jgi:hypothetical protein
MSPAGPHRPLHGSRSAGMRLAGRSVCNLHRFIEPDTGTGRPRIANCTPDAAGAGWPASCYVHSSRTIRGPIRSNYG